MRRSWHQQEEEHGQLWWYDVTDIEENVGDFVAEDVRKVSRERIRFFLWKESHVINGIACETVEGRFSKLNQNMLDLVVFAFSHGCVVEESVVCS